MSDLRKLASLDELLTFCEDAERTQTPSVAMQSMCSVYADSGRSIAMAALDPFSEEYARASLALYEEISDVSGYDPWVNERTPYVDVDQTITSPSPYQYGDSVTVSDFVLSWGWIFRNLDVKAGASILEYGAGEGQLSIQLARMGCKVAVVDIDERYLASVRAQCHSLCIDIELVQGQFGDPVRDRRFDRILFFEAFHHALDHGNVLEKLRPLLADNGFVLFSGEPIVEPGSVLVPFPWGPRLDGISVRSMRKFGWCELGFQRPYFVERLMRAGFLVSHSPCPVSGRGDCFIAKPIRAEMDIELGGPVLLDIHGLDCGWHLGEGQYRWTNGHARLTLPRLGGFAAITLWLVNHLPFPRTTLLRCGTVSIETTVESGGRACVKVPIRDGAGTLEIVTPTTQPSQLRHDVADSRALGVAVEKLRFGQ